MLRLVSEVQLLASQAPGEMIEGEGAHDLVRPARGSFALLYAQKYAVEFLCSTVSFIAQFENKRAQVVRIGVALALTRAQAFFSLQKSSNCLRHVLGRDFLLGWPEFQPIVRAD